MKYLILMVSLLLLTNCSQKPILRGKFFKPTEYERIFEYKTTKKEIKEQFGAPSFEDNIILNKWFYISYMEIKHSILKSKYNNIKIYEISFENDIVLTKAYYQYDDFFKIKPSKNKSPAYGTNQGIFARIFNLPGVFTPSPKI